MLLLAVSVIVTWYFAYQFYFFLDDSRKGADTIETLGPRIVEFNRVNEPQFQQTAAKLREYARTHPDIVPILAKYGVVQVSNVAPAAATAPKQ